MQRTTAGVIAVVALVALAGCTGFTPETTPGGSPTDGVPETEEPTGSTADEGSTSSGDGAVRFYISDEENAIGDFAHLNVTVSEVGFQSAGDDDGEDEETPTESPGTPGDNDTTTPDNETGVPDENETETPEESDPDSENETNAPGDETEDDENDADEEDESGEWIEYEVEDRTFDLTQLQGDNASLLQQFDAPEGSYTKVFVHVEEINGTLDNGESVNVKLPSERLQINQGFTVESNETIDFVFDITVHKAGNSGKYILTPVISESGTDVPIEDVDEDREENGEDEREEDEADDREDDTDDEESEDQGTIEGEEGDVETALDAAFVGTVEPGENTTVRVTANDSAVANASVVLDDEVVAITDETGQATFGVPEDADELEVGIEAGEAETELEAAFEDAPPA